MPVFGIVPDLQMVGSDIEAERVALFQNRPLEHFVGSWCGITQETLKLKISDINPAKYPPEQGKSSKHEDGRSNSPIRDWIG